MLPPQRSLKSFIFHNSKTYKNWITLESNKKALLLGSWKILIVVAQMGHMKDIGTTKLNYYEKTKWRENELFSNAPCDINKQDTKLKHISMEEKEVEECFALWDI